LPFQVEFINIFSTIIDGGEDDGSVIDGLTDAWPLSTPIVDGGVPGVYVNNIDFILVATKKINTNVRNIFYDIDALTTGKWIHGTLDGGEV